MIALVAVLAISVVGPASAMTINCVPDGFKLWQKAFESGSPLATLDRVPAPFTIDIETGAFERHIPDGTVETAQYRVLPPGGDANRTSYIALHPTWPGLLRIAFEDNAWSFLRDHYWLEQGDCTQETEG